MRTKTEKTIKILLFLSLAICVAYTSARLTDLTSSDLGRHIKNGQIVVSNIFSGNKQDVLSQNFYSYTNEEFRFINHHWAFGILVWAIYSIAGFSGLTLFLTLLKTSAFSLFFYIASKKSNFYVASLASVLLMPAIAYRNEIRPEHISYLLCGAMIWIFTLFEQEKIKTRNFLILISTIAIFWINTHIYFVFGGIIIFIFFLRQIFLKKGKEKIKTSGMSLILFSASCLVNPNFLNIISSFFIFENFGYQLFENQSISFLENLNQTNPVFLIIKISIFLIITLLATDLIINKNPKKTLNPSVVMSLIFGFMAYSSVRDITIFSFFAIVAISFLSWNAMIKAKEKFEIIKKFEKQIFVLVLILSISFFYFSKQNFLEIAKLSSGLGEYKSNSASADFFKKTDIKGPIFNNYDIGGFLIFHLFPQEKVFVDNRPEAYPASFFQNIYVPMQEKEDLWQKIDNLYNFNAIFFQRFDRTPWAQNFMIKRVQDAKWAPVFVDDFTIIFVKNNDTNKKIIQKYAIPKEYFIITEN